MEPVPLHAGVVELGRQGKSLGHVGIRPVERRVEARGRGDARKQFADCHDGGDRGGHMEGRQVGDRMEVSDHAGIDPD